MHLGKCFKKQELTKNVLYRTEPKCLPVPFRTLQSVQTCNHSSNQADHSAADVTYSQFSIQVRFSVTLPELVFQVKFHFQLQRNTFLC